MVIFDNVTVHVDETAIGGRRKYARGRIPKTKTRWLLGIVDKINHKVHVQLIPNKEFLSIIPVITRHIRPGCTINTDGANVYKCLSQMNYQHSVVIHKDCM